MSGFVSLRPLSKEPGEVTLAATPLGEPSQKVCADSSEGPSGGSLASNNQHLTTRRHTRRIKDPKDGTERRIRSHQCFQPKRRACLVGEAVSGMRGAAVVSELKGGKT